MALHTAKLDINPVSSGTQPTLALPHARHRTPNASAFSCGRATAGANAKLYNPRHPERTLLYQTIAEHFETWFELASASQFDGQGDHRTHQAF